MLIFKQGFNQDMKFKEMDRNSCEWIKIQYRMSSIFMKERWIGYETDKDARDSYRDTSSCILRDERYTDTREATD